MAINEIFSASFLFSIAIIIILIGGIFAYVSYRMGEQDHKLNSMIGLITTIAEEMQFFRSKLQRLQSIVEPKSDIPVVDQIQYASQLGGTQDLIDVSDDDVSDDDVSVDDVSVDDVSDDDDKENNEIKMLNLSLANDDVLTDTIDVEQLSSETKTIHLELEQPIELDEVDVGSEFLDNVVKDNLKNISIETSTSNVEFNDLEEELSKTDYKKLTINKLRELVVSKGLIADASKLKKQEALKLLEE